MASRDSTHLDPPLFSTNLLHIESPIPNDLSCRELDLRSMPKRLVLSSTATRAFLGDNNLDPVVPRGRSKRDSDLCWQIGERSLMPLITFDRSNPESRRRSFHIPVHCHPLDDQIPVWIASPSSVTCLPHFRIKREKIAPNTNINADHLKAVM